MAIIYAYLYQLCQERINQKNVIIYYSGFYLWLENHFLVSAFGQSDLSQVFETDDIIGSWIDILKDQFL